MSDEKEPDEPCEACGGKGYIPNTDNGRLLIIPCGMLGTDTAWTCVERCDACEEFDGDVEAADANFETVKVVESTDGSLSVLAHTPLPPNPATSLPIEDRGATFADLLGDDEEDDEPDPYEDCEGLTPGDPV